MKNAEKHDRADKFWKIIGITSSAPATAPTASERVKWSISRSLFRCPFAVHLVQQNLAQTHRMGRYFDVFVGLN
eukprot:5345031-Prorocentrum_lima.AAC.1